MMERGAMGRPWRWLGPGMGFHSSRFYVGHVFDDDGDNDSNDDDDDDDAVLPITSTSIHFFFMKKKEKKHFLRSPLINISLYLGCVVTFMDIFSSLILES